MTDQSPASPTLVERLDNYHRQFSADGQMLTCVQLIREAHDLIEAQDARIDALERERDEERRIVDRLWKALGLETYDHAKPYAIYEHVARIKAECAEAKRKNDLYLGPACYGYLKASDPEDITTIRYVPACVALAAERDELRPALAQSNALYEQVVLGQRQSQRERDELRNALTELVRLEDVRDAGTYDTYSAISEALAWEAARRALGDTP